MTQKNLDTQCKSLDYSFFKFLHYLFVCVHVGMRTYRSQNMVSDHLKPDLQAALSYPT